MSAENLNIRNTDPANQVYRPDFSAREAGNRNHLKPNKDFQKILSKKEQEENSENFEGGDLKGVDDKKGSDSAAGRSRSSSKTPSKSLFDLSSETTAGGSEVAQAGDEIAESRQQSIFGMTAKHASGKESNPGRSEMNGSIFGLAASKTGEKDTADKVAPGMAEHIPPEMSAKKTKPESPEHYSSKSKLEKEGELATVQAKLSHEEIKRNYNDNFSREQPDLAYLNPRDMGAAGAAAVANVEGMQATGPNQLQRISKIDLINQMVDQITTELKKDSTETTISLKNISGFENVRVVVTAYENAPNQYNIRFENLLPATQNLLQAHDNQNALKMALEQKGIVVHMIDYHTHEVRVDSETNVYAQNGRDQQREDQPGKEEKERQG